MHIHLSVHLLAMICRVSRGEGRRGEGRGEEGWGEEGRGGVGWG